MPHYLSDEELKRTAPAEVASFRSPVPTQIVSNGEFNPLPQTREQQRVEARIKELADDLGRRHGMDRRQFLASSAGMAAAFLAMNDVFGPIFEVSRAEAANPEVAAERAGMLEGLHDRRPALPVEDGLLLAPRRPEAHVPVLREDRQGRHHHGVHPQGAPAD